MDLSAMRLERHRSEPVAWRSSSGYSFWEQKCPECGENILLVSGYSDEELIQAAASGHSDAIVESLGVV